MKLIRQTLLHFQQGNSDKVYELDLCEAGEGEFLVNFRYGRRGSTLRDGTKTPFSVSRARAEGIFEALVADKTTKGYLIASNDGTGVAPPETRQVATPGEIDPRRVAIAKRLTEEAAGRNSKSSRWKLSRVIWRAGAWKMTESADSIAAIVPALKTEMDYWCAAWALGRCGQPKHSVALDLIEERARSVSWVLSMVSEARIALSPDESISETDQAFREHASRLEKGLREGTLDEVAQRELALFAASHPAMRGVVYELVRSLPMKRGTMAFFRQVLKSAEFRMDAELYGQVVRRIEQTRPNPYNYAIRQKALNPFPASTRNYLRRGVIRHLKVMGESGDPGLFIPLATGVLMAFDDAIDAPKETSTVTYSYDRTTRRSVQHRIWFPRYGNRLGYTWLLRGAGGTVELNAIETQWRCKSGERGDAKVREEPYPELWDQAPDAVMHLLRHARSIEAQRFALRIWRANPDFMQEADSVLIGDLLASWFPETVALGLEVAREKWNSQQPDLQLLLAMLDSSLEEARAQGIAWLQDAAAALQNNADFLSGVAFLEHEDARTGVRGVLRTTSLTKEVREEIVARVLSGLLALDDEATAGRATDWLEFIAPAEINALPDEHVAALSAHPLESCQLLAVRILLKRSSPSSLPESLLMAAASSEHAAVRSLGMKLLEQLSDVELARRVEMLAACAVSRHAELRGIAGQLLKRAATYDRSAARQLVEQWWPLLFRKEDFEGLHASVFETLTRAFDSELNVIPAGTFRQMLESKYGFGQELGFELLKREITRPDLSDTIQWAIHPLVALREWSREKLNREELRSEPAHLLRLLEGPYDDSRAWAFDFCRTELRDGDWSPEALVALCDSNHPEARTFGRELVTRLFREQDGPLYLARLSQHPSVEVQVFATNYLERFASGQPEQIEALDLYFRTVLSHIGAGRVAKRRVLAFLERESLTNYHTATFTTALLAHQSGTVAIQDKAEMIRILNDLRRMWPELAGPLKLKPVEVYQPS